MIRKKLNGVWIGELTKKDGQQIKKTMPFVLRSLSVFDVQKMADLSEKIYAKLRPEESCYIHRHNLTYYEDSLKHRDMHYIGIFVGTELIAMSSLKLCRDKETFNQEIPGCYDDMFADGQVVAALGSDCVLPAFRGNRLNQIMIDFRISKARQLGCTHAFSIVDRHNHWNMTPYFSNGFTMFSSAVDPSDNGQIALMQRHLCSKVWYSKTQITAPCYDFDRIDALLNNGYVGCAYNAQTNRISFVRMCDTNSRLKCCPTSICSEPIRIASFSKDSYAISPRLKYYARV